MHALQLAELEILDFATEIAQVLQVLDIGAILGRLVGLGVNDGDFAGLGYALARTPHQGFVDPLLDDLVPDVVSAIHIEALLVETETDRQRRVLYEDQMCSLQRQR